MGARWPKLLAAFLLLATLAFAQSLAELAKKEKERRKKTDKDVEVIDDRALRTGSPAEDEPPPAGESKASDPATAETRSAPPATTSADHRERCNAELERAKAEKERLRKQYDAGIASSATAPGDQVRGSDGRGIPGTGTPDVRVGSRTSCSQALGDSKFYAEAAARCRALQSRIDAAEEKIRAANDCFRKR